MSSQVTNVIALHFASALNMVITFHDFSMILNYLQLEKVELYCFETLPCRCKNTQCKYFPYVDKAFSKSILDIF